MTETYSESLYSKDVKFYCYDTINSTNRYALDNINEFNDFSIISADTQSSGRGRFDRNWKSDKNGNIYASIVLKDLPEYNEESPIATITQYMAVTVKNVLREYIKNISIKWPNDILVNNKKICGILSSAVFSKNRLDAVVIGFGINITNTKEDLESIEKPATSLLIEYNKIVDKKEILQKISKLFFKNLDLFLDKGFSIIKDEYLASSSTIDTNVTVHTPQGSVSGFAESIDDKGILTIIDNEENKIKINTGDVVW